MPTMTPRGRATRKDTFRVSLTVDGVDYGLWDTKTGGKITADQGTPYKMGGMTIPIALGGPVSTENVVLERLFTLEDDANRGGQLANAVGKGQAVIKQIPLDTDGNAYSKVGVYTGTLTGLSPLPDFDANSGDPALVVAEITITGTPTIQ